MADKANTMFTRLDKLFKSESSTPPSIECDPQAQPRSTRARKLTSFALSIDVKTWKVSYAPVVVSLNLPFSFAKIHYMLMSFENETSNDNVFNRMEEKGQL